MAALADCESQRSSVVMYASRARFQRMLDLNHAPINRRFFACIAPVPVQLVRGGCLLHA